MINDRAADFTQVDNNAIETAYKNKINKYGRIYNNKPVIPIVVTHGISINLASLLEIKDFVNINRLRAELAYRLIQGNLMRIDKYQTMVQNKFHDTYNYNNK